MGGGIAHVAAQAGLTVTLCDLEQGILDRALSTIKRNMEREVRKDARTADQMQEALKRISASTDCNDLDESDFVIEAAREDLQTKLEVFATLSRIVREGTPIASNTSSLSITRIGASAIRPDRVVGMHFMNPVPMMPLVEVVRGLNTSEATVTTTQTLSEILGKTPIIVQDSPGFVSNRLLMPMINEAVTCLMEGVGTREAIDGIMKLGMRHPMGPLALADMIGLDVCLQVMEVLYAGFGDSKYRPCPLLRRMVDAGHLGRKSGQGFYAYP